MITENGARRAIGKFALMKFFPGDLDTRAALVEGLTQMCNDDEELDWLTTLTTQLKEWPGFAELRGLYCKRFSPRDGIEAYSEIYPDTLPPQFQAPFNRQIAGPEMKALPAGSVASVDPECEKTVSELSAGLTKLRPIAHHAKDASTLAVEEKLRQMGL